MTINDLIVPTADPRLPFGGRGESGYGVTRGAEGLLDLTAVKAVSVRRGSWLPHLDERRPGDEELFQAWLAAAHGDGVAARVRGAVRLVKAMIRERKIMTKQPIGVIGGGLGGLAAACTLAARGHHVMLFERNAWLGGKAAVLCTRAASASTWGRPF